MAKAVLACAMSGHSMEQSYPRSICFSFDVCGFFFLNYSLIVSTSSIAFPSFSTVAFNILTLPEMKYVCSKISLASTQSIKIQHNILNDKNRYLKVWYASLTLEVT